MKLISLNLWGGRGGREGLVDFFERYRDVDIFCLQEVWNGGQHMAGVMASSFPVEDVVFEIFSDIASVLPEHVAYFRPHYGDWYGLVIFIKKGITVLEEGERYVYKERGFVGEDNHGNHARNIQWMEIETAAGPRLIVNFHGLWNGKGKTDTADRLLQSDNIAAFLRERSSPYVLCGDFNLLPETESLSRLEELALRNLVKEYAFTSTRSSFYTKPERYADYALVSEGITVTDFSVLPDEVSDHLPLYLDFE